MMITKSYFLQLIVILQSSVNINHKASIFTESHDQNGLEWYKICTKSSDLARPCTWHQTKLEPIFQGSYNKFQTLTSARTKQMNF